MPPAGPPSPADPPVPDTGAADPRTEQQTPDPDTTETEDIVLDVDGFDLDEWLEGAEPTTRTVDVYAAGSLVAERDDLERQIKALESPAVRTLGGNPADDLRRQWRELMDRILASKLTVHVRALSKDRSREVAAAYRKARGIKLSDAPTMKSMFDPVKIKRWDEEGQMDACTRAAIVKLVAPNGAVIKPPFTSDAQFETFQEKIGPAQWGMVREAYEEAVSKSPVVGVDFSPASSDDRDGEDD
ncbi:MAG: hypothetical protein Q4G67_03160 [Actinomycetia bacterium]|nr:hypothetical protein [Actinomycetes bacterium]